MRRIAVVIIAALVFAYYRSEKAPANMAVVEAQPPCTRVGDVCVLRSGAIFERAQSVDVPGNCMYPHGNRIVTLRAGNEIRVMRKGDRARVVVTRAIEEK